MTKKEFNRRYGDLGLQLGIAWKKLGGSYLAKTDSLIWSFDRVDGATMPHALLEFSLDQDRCRMTFADLTEVASATFSIDGAISMLATFIQKQAIARLTQATEVLQALNIANNLMLATQAETALTLIGPRS